MSNTGVVFVSAQDDKNYHVSSIDINLYEPEMSGGGARDAAGVQVRAFLEKS